MRLFYSLLLFCGFFVGLMMIGCGDNPTGGTTDEPPKVDTTSTEGGQITGRVLPPGVGPLVIVIRNGVDFTSTLADEEGQFEISNLPSGQYSLQVIATGFFTDISISNVELQKGESRQAELIILRQRSEGATLLGQIINKSNRQPIEGAEVQIECSTGVCAPLSGLSDQDGNFSVKIWSGLGANINVRKPGYRTLPIQVKALDPAQEFNMGKIALERLEQ